MLFKLWLENQQIEIDEPYYRIVSPMHGGGAARNSMGETDPGTYWTPRWDAILLMIQSIFTHSQLSKLRFNDDNWNVKIYQINKAIMEPAPKDHKWAFNYSTDAGEMILVKAIEPAKIIFNGNAEDLEDYVQDSYKVNRPTDHSVNGVKATWNGQQVFIVPQQNDIIVSKQDGWKFTPILTIKSMSAFERFSKDAEIDWDSEEAVGLAYFFQDAGW